MVLEEPLEGNNDVGGEGEGGLGLQTALDQLLLERRIPNKNSIKIIFKTKRR